MKRFCFTSCAMLQFAMPFAPDQRDSKKYDSIHRALLTGLLSNVGVKTEAHEYLGVRSKKFAIFPGSGLFRRGPRWLMAAELVETTRLYARTAARIHSDWIERLAPHLVKKTYSDPQWQEPTAHVMAIEKVIFYGLTLVEKRLVHYGPIDPVLSRQIFIQHALVNGEYASRAPFLKHNQNLIDEIVALEARVRRHDLLVEIPVRFEFYEKRIPTGIYNGPLFERWRHAAEQQDPKVLFMSREDILRHAWEKIPQELYPDHFDLEGEIRLPLEYTLDPSDPNDGATVIVPLPLLPQLPPEPFEWVIRGWLKEKMVELIRTLPKHLRVHFVPAPDVADEAYRMLEPGGGSLHGALAHFLGKRSGLPVRPEEFDAARLPSYLRMNFRIVDETGRTVAAGRDLPEIRQRLGVQARATFAAMHKSGDFHRDNITSWDFGDLPEHVEIRRHGMTLLGFPALVDMQTSVSLRLLESQESAQAAMGPGLRRLFMVQTRQEVRYLERNLPQIEKMSLYYAPLGLLKELKHDIAQASASRAFFGTNAAAGGISANEIRTRAAFVERAQIAWNRLLLVGREVADLSADTLAQRHEAARQLERVFPAAVLPAVNDMRRQLHALVTKHFLIETPAPWLQHLPRYLQAINVRLSKLMNAGLSRDSAQASVLAPLQQQYLSRVERHRKVGLIDLELETYRWMLEELRVSLFAQELKTAIPISPKRLEAQWLKVKA